MADMIDVLLAYHKGGSGSGGGYNDSELRSKIATIQQQVDQCGTDIEAIQGVLEDHADDIETLQTALGTQGNTLADLARRLAAAEAAVTGLEAATTDHETRIAALEANGGSGSDCDGECCVQHSILNGNGWDEESGTDPEPTPEQTTWQQFVQFCKDNYNDELIGYQITDDGEASYEFNIVSMTQMVNAEDNKTYDCIVLENTVAIGSEIPFDAPEMQLAEGKYKNNLYYYKASGDSQAPYELLHAGVDYVVGDDIEGEIFVNSNEDASGEIVGKGSNKWSESFVRQYLNADSASDFAPTHIGDVLPEVLPTTSYLEGLSAALKEVIMPVNFDSCVNKVLLPSITQMNGIASPAIGEPFEYWVKAMNNIAPTNSTNSKRAIKDANDTIVFAALIDANPDTSYKRGYIMKGAKAGQINYSSCYNPTAFTPIFYIPIKEAE